MLTAVIPEARRADSTNILLPVRQQRDTDEEWHRRTVQRVVKVIRQWEQAADRRPNQSTLRRHFVNKIQNVNSLITEEVAKHIKSVNIDPAGERRVQVVAKTKAERQREANCAQILVPQTPAGPRRQLQPIGNDGPDTVARQFTQNEE